MPKVQIDCKIRVMHALSLEICIPVVKSQPTLTYADLRLSAIEARQMKIGGLYLYLYMDCVRAVQSCCMLTIYIFLEKGVSSIHLLFIKGFPIVLLGLAVIIHPASSNYFTL